MLLGTGLSNIFSFVNEDPNNPTDPQAQQDYNHAAIQVRAAPRLGGPPCACNRLCPCLPARSPFAESSRSPSTRASPHPFPVPLAVQVAFIAGLMYTAVGLLRLGWITNFLSHTTISGFMSVSSRCSWPPVAAPWVPARRSAFGPAELRVSGLPEVGPSAG